MKSRFSAEVTGLAVIGIAWALLLSALLVVPTIPTFNQWIDLPHLLMGAVIALIVGGLLVTRRNQSSSELVLFTILLAVVVVFVLEAIQFPSSTRAVEIDDLIEGVAGSTLGGFLVWILISTIGPKYTVRSILAVCGIAIFPVAFYSLSTLNDPATTKAQPEALVCDTPIASTVVRIEGANTLLCFRQGVTVKKQSLHFNNGMAFSHNLEELAQAITVSNELSFHIDFTADQPDKPQRLSQIAALLRNEDERTALLRVLQRGSHVYVSVYFANRFESVRIDLPNQVDGLAHSLSVSISETEVNAYFDHRLVSTAELTRTVWDLTNDDLQLVVGHRSDARWTPFSGSVAKIVVNASHDYSSTVNK